MVAIDGPSGSGKSSTARGVAERLGTGLPRHRRHVPRGHLAGADSEVAADDIAAVAALVESARHRHRRRPGRPRIAINGTDVTDGDPRAGACPRRSSSVATNLAVPRRSGRPAAGDHRRGAERGIVAEGRDITTVVAPDADVRVLLVADPSARVARRHAELGQRVDQRRRAPTR